jgi:hypothetical protein
MVLRKYPIASIRGSISGRASQYSVSGLPAGEYAFIAEFPPSGWRILRWNSEWHGNWIGSYNTAEEALDALRVELLTLAS